MPTAMGSNAIDGETVAVADGWTSRDEFGRVGIVREDREDRRDQHQHEAEACHEIPHVGFLWIDRAKQQSRRPADERALPDEMNQRPTDRLNQRRVEQPITHGSSPRALSTADGFREAPARTQAWRPAPASRAVMVTRQTPGRGGRV